MPPRIAIVGWGRAGKDEAGKILSRLSSLRYSGSTSNVVCPLIAAELGLTPEEAWATRHANRQFWKDWCDNYRRDDPARIIRKLLETSDMAIGIRGKEELLCAQREGLVSLTVWIENPRVPPDYTVEFDHTLADLVIHNDSNLTLYNTRLRRLANFAGLLTHDTVGTAG